MRGQFQKELKNCNQLCPKSGVIRGSTWPYLNRMKFLECTVLAYKPKKEKLSKRKLRELKQMEEESVWDAEENSEEHSVINVEVEDLEVMDDSYVSDEYAIIEEIAEEVVGTETIEETHEYGSNNTLENYSKMQTLLSGFEEEALLCMDRRIIAFLCKCQLRALSDQNIDDLFV